MKAVCVCFEVHLPLPLKWYWPREGYGAPALEKYFEMERSYNSFLRLEKDIRVLNSALMASMEVGGRYTFDISGIFLEQCKWEPAILDSFRQLADKGAGLVASPYYHSICPMFPDLQEFREQVSMHMDSLKDIFGVTPVSFANPELLLDQRTNDSCRDLGFKCFISEGSHNIVNGCDPVHVYRNEVPTLLRHINLSEDVEKRLSDRKWPGYPLIAEKFASWVAGMEGDVLTLYIKYDSLQVHLQRNAEIVQFLIELPLSLARHGIKMLLPEEAAGRFRQEELPSLYSKKTARYGMHNLMGNHAQHLYMHELQSIGNELGKLTSHEEHEKLQSIYRYLQQSDIFLEMNAEGRRLGYEKAVNNFSILSDMKRALTEAGT
ncbi:MAG: alpha-amylase [Methanolobus sp.]|nr:alpha-amylase [Methanolobus sp.]MDK2833183.1 alpha-amylase [Methanolobus sp.]MDK2912426.1 alpha-amylase [Methanolobus sp.]MDN5310254.1 alpha-amylase [Methanolobus sp.]